MIIARLVVWAVMATVASAAPDVLGEATPRIARFELTGPTSGGLLNCGLSEARVEVSLARGESRAVRVPFSHVAEDAECNPAPVAWSSGQARFVGWDASSRESDWSSLPAGLRRRAIPVPPGTRSNPTAAGWLALIAGLVLVRLFQERQRTAALLGLAAGAALLILPVTETVGSDEAIVVEGDGASGKWVRVSVQSRSSAMDLDRLLRLAVLPEGARLNWAATSTAGGELIWTAEGAGDETARIISCERFFPPNAPTNSPAETEAGGRHPGLSLTSTWLRSASGGKLVSHGAWERGTPLPAAREDGLGPPSWLAAGLPQGVGVLLGRSKNDQDQEIWVRLIGFSED